MPNYLSNKRPDFKPFTAELGKIPAYQFKNDLAAELKAKRLTKAQALDLYEDMLMVREVEDMIVRLRSGAYELASRADVPAKVVISEYVDVAKAFFDADVAGMVNGVLDGLARTMRPAELAAQPARP